jgi:hypothetical protein
VRHVRLEKAEVSRKGMPRTERRSREDEEEQALECEEEQRTPRTGRTTRQSRPSPNRRATPTHDNPLRAVIEQTRDPVVLA